MVYRFYIQEKEKFMNNRLEQLLALWQPQKSALEWVLATVIETQGSSYRKPGAMMLINSLGQYYGLISGGCLEADIMRKSRKCLDTGENQIVCYDMREEDDLSWQLGIGCGGMVKILLQPITAQSNWLELDFLAAQLDKRQTSFYQQNISLGEANNKVFTVCERSELGLSCNYFTHEIKPRPALAIFGGGVDAIPVVNMAKTLGWQTFVIDERVNYARRAYFENADSVIRQSLDSLTDEPFLQAVDAIIIMNHNVALDAKALVLAQQSSAKFVGMLGPSHRTEKVLQCVNFTYSDLTKNLSNPVGLDIGGQLPESLALSMLSEAHAVLENRKGQSLTVR